MSLTVKCFPYAPLGENTYIITDEATGFKAVVDPGYFGLDVRMEIQNKAYLKYILLTHGHYDHFAAAQDYIDEYPDAVFAAPAGETYLMYGSRDNEWMAQGRGSGRCPQASLLLKEGDVVSLGETDLRIIETPGHTEGGICFVTDNEAFTGDTLFRLSVGNTSFETGNWPTMVASIQNKLYTLPAELIVYPGHGEPTTIGFEKRANPFV
ncbi:MAG: MBL fold metallo-hydrolase [Mogibacterium sp.]|nr:MBL fold metallo-hydrolase [Mogibacterium sp.]